jgi:glucose-6-phosphate 1-dehydrogenase
MAGPPELFEVVVTALAQNGLAANARLVIEKPFGRDRVGAGGPWLNPQPPIAR